MPLYNPNPSIIVPDQRVFSSRLDGPPNGFGALTSGTAYFVYLGLLTQGITPGHVLFYVFGAGAGAQTAEVCCASTPSAPNRANQTVTVLSAITNANITTLTTTGLKTQTGGSFSAVPAGTHLWIGIRTAMATTQPSIYGLYFDNGQGAVLRTAGASAFAASNTYTGSVQTATDNPMSPSLQLSLD